MCLFDEKRREFGVLQHFILFLEFSIEFLTANEHSETERQRERKRIPRMFLSARMVYNNRMADPQN